MHYFYCKQILHSLTPMTSNMYTNYLAKAENVRIIIIIVIIIIIIIEFVWFQFSLTHKDIVSNCLKRTDLLVPAISYFLVVIIFIVPDHL